MTAFDARKYGAIIAELLSAPRLAELGPGSPDRRRHETIKHLTVESLFAPAKVRDADMAAACLAGLWLYFDFLDQSHEISQGIGTPTGSYWHGIMHRREPDYDNAKYWFRRVGTHPVYEPLSSAARDIAARSNSTGEEPGPAAGFLVTQVNWDASRFVDLCRHTTQEGSACESLCREIQHLEWQLLFDDCYRCAVQG